MPTASAHLAAALDLLDDPAFAARQRLASGPPYSAFLLGSISPDVRVVNGLAREETHFYEIPLVPGKVASQSMLRAHPSLADAAALPPAQAAFVAGYMAHLIMDEVWLDVVVMPYIFIDGADWDVRHPNYRLYSLLMTHLAEQGDQRLPPDMADTLRAAQPDGWLPFASDEQLVEWRERVIKHALSDGGWRTARMFAHLMNADANALYAVVTSPEAMARESFAVVPRDVLDSFQRQTHARCVATIDTYLMPAGSS